MQNGLVEDQVAGIVGADRTLGCIASTLSAEAHRPGGIVRTRQPGGSAYTIFRAGELHGRMTPRLEALVAMLGQVDSARATSNLWGERWSKLVANTMTTALSAGTGMTLKSVVAGAGTRAIMVRLAAESIRIGHALGFALEPIRTLDAQAWLDAQEGNAAAIRAVGAAFDRELERMTDLGYSGMAQDLRKGRRTENAFMNGHVAQRGRECGLSAPTHEMLATMIGRIERGEQSMDPGNLGVLATGR
jgi:2-dehydropantoate 2-reductase